jgi:hypothetical protein
MSKNRTHNYPKNRKPRDTSYSESYRLVEEYGLDQIKEIWTECGMYRTAGKLDTSPYVIRYLAHKHEWRRPAEKAPAILKGVRNGRVSADHYKTLDFSNTNINETEE